MCVERKVLQKFFEPVYDQGIQVRKKRHNQELMDVFKRQKGIVNNNKRNKLEWADHEYRKQNSMILRVQ